MDDPRVAITLATVALFGACVGSFLNVVAWRLPRACMSIAKPRSRCPRCSNLIGWYDNLPVVSWLLLRGRCRRCRARISVRYPLVEVLTAAAFVVVAWRVLPAQALRDPLGGGFLWSWVDVLVRFLITGALMALTLIDLDYFILPDRITIPGIALGPVLAFLAPEVQPTPVIESWLPDFGPRAVAAIHGVLGAATGFAVLWGIGALGSLAFKKPAMGFGDVKMFAAMGGVLGFWCLVALLVAVVAGAAIGIVVKLAGKGRYIPFGPFLAIGMWVVMLWGEPVLSAWLRLSHALSFCSR